MVTKGGTTAVARMPPSITVIASVVSPNILSTNTDARAAGKSFEERVMPAIRAASMPTIPGTKMPTKLLIKFTRIKTGIAARLRGINTHHLTAP